MNRITPQGPVQAYRTFEIASPLATHWRRATCEEVDCANYLRGWRSVIDESTVLGQGQAHYIRHDTSRRHTEERRPDGLTEFVFEAGQMCFQASAHKIQVRPELYVSRGGDWRGATTAPLTHSGPDPWLDEFQTNQDRLATLHGRG